eukprot:3364830-Lingulodinium_polyedra.AAC.1
MELRRRLRVVFAASRLRNRADLKSVIAYVAGVTGKQGPVSLHSGVVCADAGTVARFQLVVDAAYCCRTRD